MEGTFTMKIGQKRRHQIIAASLVAALGAAALVSAFAQAPQGGTDDLLRAARAHPGCLGVETGQTSNGRRVIFAWFENKQSLVAWYKSDAHQKAMKRAFPNQNFHREPLPDTPENSGQILAIVSLKPRDTPGPDGTALSIASIGIELYTPLPGGIAVNGRFAPDAVRVPHLREITIETAGQPR
jgi:hypothetical protein